jgi:hypothetical protein
VAERAGLENRRWGNPSASSNLAPSANESGHERNILCFSEIVAMFRRDGARAFPLSVLLLGACSGFGGRFLWRGISKFSFTDGY